ncbi:major histocompatibility complex class I-related gene protein-like isoform X1 [Pygocentrus nattereri]|uniref:Ig-like domain-containing protein n=2 Tax=Pygocentrus nattereri TaxID=42514 RepID=A0A3B4EFH8_PYGNA|nr:major histocompatibility complex class I-related gene protein-like isoform X1 [Pygocentrus nattereri]XP_037389475.1 major histocompatibility complex class I-related gene protein-like isoform X1 [Pygocentrus nattereri]
MKLFLLLLCASHTAAEIYLYITKFTAVTGIAGLPEFTAVSFLHGKQIDYYDSKCHTLLPRQVWAKRVFGDPYWQRTTRLRFSESLHLQNGLSSAMESSGHKEGVHTFQRMYGCLWDEDTGYSDGFDVYGYDGVNFITLNLESRRFSALVPEAKSMAQEWNRNTTQIETLLLYYTHECVAWLKTFFVKNHKQHKYWGAAYQYYEFEAIVIPTITQHLRPGLLSVVVCHVTDLSTETVQVSWQKNEEDVKDYVEIGETLPSGDGTFQKTIYLAVRLEELKKNKYSCAVEFRTLTGKSLLTISQDTLFKMNYGAHSHTHARHSKWGSNDEDDYDDEAYVDEDYDDDDDDDDN